MKFYQINLLFLLVFALPFLGGCGNRYALHTKGRFVFGDTIPLLMRANTGDADAQYKLAYYYLNTCRIDADGTAMPLNEKEGIKWLRKAAKQEHAEAMCELGRAYQNGRGVPEDKEEAVRWFRKSVEHGNAAALCALAQCYFDGLGVPEDKMEAVKLFRQAAEQGFPNGMYQLGHCYFKGEGVPEDKVEAVKWFRKCAELGFFPGQYMLGKCYYNGEGVLQDKTEAILWYRKAAEIDQEARFELIRCYLKDEYVPDETEMEEWISLLRLWAANDSVFFISGKRDEDFWNGLKQRQNQAAELLREMEKKYPSNFAETI